MHFLVNAGSSIIENKLGGGLNFLISISCGRPYYNKIFINSSCTRIKSFLFIDYSNERLDLQIGAHDIRLKKLCFQKLQFSCWSLKFDCNVSGVDFIYKYRVFTVHWDMCKSILDIQHIRSSPRTIFFYITKAITFRHIVKNSPYNYIQNIQVYKLLKDYSFLLYLIFISIISISNFRYLINHASRCLSRSLSSSVRIFLRSHAIKVDMNSTNLFC